MRSHKPGGREFLAAVYRGLLRAFPHGFRAEFEDEMVDVFRERLESAAADGVPAMLALLLSEVGGLVAGGLRRRLTVHPERPALLARIGGGAEPLVESPRPFPIKVALTAILVILAIATLFRAAQNFWYSTLDVTFDVRHVALGDFNGDGLADMYLSVGSVADGYWRADRVLINQGNGRFNDSGQELGEWRSFAAATGDIDDDGLVDVVSADYTGLIYYRNDGGGWMEATRYDPGDFVHRSTHLSTTLADLNSDGRLDVFSTGCCGWIGDEGRGPRHDAYSEVWLNDGAGGLLVTGHKIGRVGSNAAALADLNGDGTIDAFLANGQTIGEVGAAPVASRLAALRHGQFGPSIFIYESPNMVWFNDGRGVFNDSGQRLGASESHAVALGDVNGDGFPDAVVGNRGADEVWLNDGRGSFTLGQRLGSSVTWSVFLADQDGDGDLDLVTGGETSGRVWLNDGAGVFSRGQPVRYGRYQSIVVGDVTGDGIADIVSAGEDSYRIWRGQGDGRFVADPRGSYEVMYGAEQ